MTKAPPYNLQSRTVEPKPRAGAPYRLFDWRDDEEQLTHAGQLPVPEAFTEEEES